MAFYSRFWNLKDLHMVTLFSPVGLKILTMLLLPFYLGDTHHIHTHVNVYSYIHIFVLYIMYI